MPKLRIRSLLALIASAVLSLQVALAMPPQTDPNIAAEIERTRQLAQRQTDDEDWKGLQPRVEEFLTRAHDEFQSGRTWLALEDLGRAKVYVEAHDTMAKAGAADLKAFESSWGKASVQLVAESQKAGGWDWGKTPAAMRAVAEAAQGQSRILLEASRAYANVTAPQYGYFYLGEAEANAHLAQFVHSLHAEAKQAYAGRSIADEIESLQQKINAEFKPPKSIERHSDFILLNSTLKLARDLDQQKLYAGALYKYLSAVQLLAMMDAQSPASETRSGLRAEMEAAGKKLNTARDESVAQLFLERAESLIAAPDASDADWTNAATITHNVLPAYEAAMSAPPALPQRAAALATITLVRWPYT